MSTKPVVVYGASGYTGRLVCEYLREYNVPFTAAGRDKDRIQQVLEKIPGIETVDHDIVEVDHDVASLTDLFRGAQVVSNMVGPFIKYGPEVVEASLAAGCHYLDTTGEQDWVLDAKSKWGKAFADKGLLLAPEHRADVHHRRDRREHLPGDARSRHPGHPGAVEGFSDLRLHADDLHHPQGGPLLPRAEPVQAVGADHHLRGVDPRPALNRASRCPGAERRTRCGSRTTRGWPT